MKKFLAIVIILLSSLAVSKSYAVQIDRFKAYSMSIKCEETNNKWCEEFSDNTVVTIDIDKEEITFYGKTTLVLKIVNLNVKNKEEVSFRCVDSSGSYLTIRERICGQTVQFYVEFVNESYCFNTKCVN